MKKVMIYAYTANNFGDDLFIYILCKRYPKTEFLLYAPSIYEQTFTNIPNLTIIASDSFSHKISRFILRPFNQQYKLREKNARTCDAAVYIGGSLFMETATWKAEVNNVKSMMRRKVPFFIIGANFGPYTTEHFYNIYESLFTQCTDVCFRDEKSYKLFQHVPTVRHASDVVFQLSGPRQLTEENYVVISVIYPSIRQHLKPFDDVYFKQMKQITETYIEAGFEVVLTGFCENENDHLAVERIITLIPTKFHKYIRAHNYKTNINETLQLFAEAKAIVASRFHAMILGLLFHKPTFPIVYSDKMTSVLQEMEFAGAYWRIEKIEQMNVQDVLDFGRNTHSNVMNDIQSSHKHFLLLDQILKN